MRQILQDLKNGATWLEEVPCPRAGEGQVLIRTTVSLISAGTERMLVEFGKGGYLQKARQQPEKVRMVLDKVRTDGLLPTIEAVRSKLEQPIPLGYCNVGIVLGPGAGGLGQRVWGRGHGAEGRGFGAEGLGQRADSGSTCVVQGLSASPFRPGDRVVSNGPHAEIVRVPVNLCARVPDGVSDEQAAFTVLGAIGLQGLRLAKPGLGECFVVTGVGLIGLLTVQLLKAHGCRVLAIDPDEAKLELARGFGAQTCNPARGEDPVAIGRAFSRGRGVDGVLICASTSSSDPVAQAARMCRKRGRIVLVGVTGLELNRADFYEKELTFQVSCSYGPGRYDPEYEDKGHDYPIGYVRWTEQRNFEAVLDMLADGRLDVRPLITHRFAFEDAGKAYEMLSGDKEWYLGIVLEYGESVGRLVGQSVCRSGGESVSQGLDDEGKVGNVENNAGMLECWNGKDTRTVKLSKGRAVGQSDGGAVQPVVSFIGAGNYASRVLIPAFQAAGVELRTIVSSGGVNGTVHGKKAGFAYASTDVEAMLADERVNTVVIATRHNTHARFLIQALKAGKHVFVEKPLCLTLDELQEIKDSYSSLITHHSSLNLMVGFNRRFAPQIQKMKSLLDTVREPKSFIMTMNAGAVPADHWTQDSKIGGGRIIGEACHYIDLMRYLVGHPIVSVQVAGMGMNGSGEITEDKATITLCFADGSFGTIHYLANGHKSFPKERIEVFTASRVLQLDNFRKLWGYGWPGFRKMHLWRQDKGTLQCVAAFVAAIQGGGECPIPVQEVLEVSKIAIQAKERLHVLTCRQA